MWRTTGCNATSTSSRTARIAKTSFGDSHRRSKTAGSARVRSYFVPKPLLRDLSQNARRLCTIAVRSRWVCVQRKLSREPSPKLTLRVGLRIQCRPGGSRRRKRRHGLSIPGFDCFLFRPCVFNALWRIFVIDFADLCHTCAEINLRGFQPISQCCFRP